MYGPTLMAIRSYQTREYICHNPQNGDVEIKVRSSSFFYNVHMEEIDRLLSEGKKKRKAASYKGGEGTSVATIPSAVIVTSIYFYAWLQEYYENKIKSYVLTVLIP